MIILDTHIWVWWVHGDERITSSQTEVIKANESDIIGVSAISAWEIAKLVEYDRLTLPCHLQEWFSEALSYPGVRLIELTPEIAVESTKLPGGFHRDPADQIIVATARLQDSAIVTSDSKILQYPHVNSVS
ncbi:type II toxin-antitoxin system VapC family toxin [Desulfonatronovibrio magnus]|uniref:type II toxin-antitoxin system VapC family toxin n=1 Tax=Desulfonatronovibrio magnus TaxID=698827 RepID=UPI0005EB29A7|nr:type II toxin-antitoxin system VapC family toxin [Desulfonatronovibrio magnus]